MAAYEGTLRTAIHAFKYQGRSSLAVPFAEHLYRAGVDVLCDASCTIPVPLHTGRRLSRGFNQAAELAAALPLPSIVALCRTRATEPQEHLGAAARRRNVNGAFTLSPFLRAQVRARYVEGQAVVLIDDVRTTGATLDQCARVLKAAGAREVRALVVAVARVDKGTSSELRSG